MHFQHFFPQKLLSGGAKFKGEMICEHKEIPKNISFQSKRRNTEALLVSGLIERIPAN